MRIRLIKAIVFALAITLTSACSDEEVIKDDPKGNSQINWRMTHELEEFIQSYTNSGLIEDTVILQLTVSASASEGNLPDEIFFQAGDAAISIASSNQSNEWDKGVELYLLATGLYYDTDKKLLSQNSTGDPLAKDSLQARILKIDSDKTVGYKVVTDLSTLNSDFHKKKVKVFNIQFSENLVGETVSTESLNELKDVKGNSVYLQISNEASFSDFTIPYESGSIEGILLVESNKYTLIPDVSESLNFNAGRHSMFTKEIFESNGKSIPYQVMYPKDYDDQKSYPLILFLHGAGERGTNNTSQMAYGTQVFNNQNARVNYPAIVIYPQCPPEFMWSRRTKETIDGELIFTFPVEASPNEPIGLLIELTQNMINSGAVDPAKVYVMGLSMGGIGTLEYLYYAPEIPAAALSIAGGHDATLVETYGNNLAIRLYHGSNDGVVPPRYSRELIDELNKLPNSKAEYFEAEGKGHEWNYILNESDSILSWMWENSKMP